MKRFVFALALLAATPAAAAERHELGTAFAMAGTFCPSNAMPADGRVLEVKEHEPLFSLFEGRYGGDGVKTFGLPDLRKGVSGASPSNGPPLTWCVVVDGQYPEREHH